jgi:hypothetical protein
MSEKSETPEGCEDLESSPALGHYSAEVLKAVLRILSAQRELKKRNQKGNRD